MLAPGGEPLFLFLASWSWRRRRFPLRAAFPPGAAFSAATAMTKLAFADGADIHTINADGTGGINLTNNATHGSGAIDVSPSWSPDGSLIAFASDGRATGAGIYVMAPAGSGVSRILASTWVA